MTPYTNILENFTVSTHQGFIDVNRNSNETLRIRYTPGETNIAEGLITTALSIVDLPQKPPHISNPPFTIRFFSSKSEAGSFILALERTDSGGSLPFRLKEADELILVLRMGMNMCLNEQTQGGVIPVRGQMGYTMDGDEPT